MNRARMVGRGFVALCVVAGLVAVWLLWPRAAYVPEAISDLPTIAATATATPHVSPSATASPTPSHGKKQAPPAVKKVEKPIVIKTSAPTTLYLPNDDADKDIRTELLPLECGINIPYPTSGPKVWRGFYCTDRALPGTDMPYYGIITGHSTTSSQTDTVMNRLLANSEKIVGKQIYVRTKKSGKRWLVFTFTEVVTVPKDDLGAAKSVWGTNDTSTAGRLVFLTCGQKRYGYSTHDNVLIVAQFSGVR